ncbi:uncharacterized protein ALTATR162_LOCUS5719 [Alternaria atra]|uniref:Uncharacterized protein n=1 Tax=Alternaria atra TaxID=119953 RepID=A0A8J2N697_9PLEO|nr:uncharacterized protein ALTATR162_LOCUS5719 [Alternaria atra]CAG5160019.1 unnamed protein product [Alternaria atra]
MEQTHAYYEEIDSTPASTVNQTSAFSTGCWWVVHPVTCVDVLDLGTRVLMDVRVWIEETMPNELFVQKAKHVMDFKTARQETLENVMKELGKRKTKGDVGGEEGYVGGWETVGSENDEKEVLEANGEDGNNEHKAEEGKKAKRLSRNSDAQLEEAAAAGRRAAEEARVKDEYEYVV